MLYIYMSNEKDRINEIIYYDWDLQMHFNLKVAIIMTQ